MKKDEKKKLHRFSTVTSFHWKLKAHTHNKYVYVNYISKYLTMTASCCASYAIDMQFHWIVQYEYTNQMTFQSSIHLIYSTFLKHKVLFVVAFLDVLNAMWTQYLCIFIYIYIFAESDRDTSYFHWFLLRLV